MLLLVLVKPLHIYFHHLPAVHCCCEAHSDSDSEDSSPEKSNHDCAICKYIFPLFIENELIVINPASQVCLDFTTIYYQHEISVATTHKKSRAPPVA